MVEYELKAKEIAYKAHKNQLRKTSGEPYIVHLINVNRILKVLTSDDEILAIGWLHDILEDTKYTIDDLYGFTNKIYTGLKIKTEDKSLTWKERKQNQINNFNNADNIPIIGRKILLVTFADKLANLKDLCKLRSKYGLDNMFKDFSEKNISEQFWYYNSFYEIFLKNKDLFKKELLDEYLNSMLYIWKK